jgi:hypothetical protein
MTLARDAAEEQTLRTSLAHLSSAGLPIAVTDGGSPAGFVESLRGLPNVHVVANHEGPGLVGQVRSSLTYARRWNTTRILYTEPDKHRWFVDHLPAFLGAAAGRPEASLVLASRTPGSFASYPRSQQYAETVVNELCGEATGLVTDYSYGPFMVKTRLLDALETVPLSLGWGWRPYLFVRVARSAGGLAHVDGDYDCPEEQRRDSAEERTHRLRQLAQNISGIVLASA